MPIKSSVAKDVFAYLFVFVMLYIGVIHFIRLLWNVIGALFPDAASFGWWDPYDNMRDSIASLIIVWPAFLLMSRSLARDLECHPEKADLWVRRWLTYLTVFVAAMTVIVDLIILVNSFLGGELTTRFVLKMLTVLLVALAVFGYEFWELKRKPEDGKKEQRRMAAGSGVLVLLAIFAGFYFVGTPKTARQYKLDNQRVTDLQSLQSQAIYYWNQKGSLPENLEALRDPITGFVLPLDPETEQPYAYDVKGELTFELCATFARPTPEWERKRERPEYLRMDAFGRPFADEWNHEAGHTCYERTVDPELHRTEKPPMM